MSHKKSVRNTAKMDPMENLFRAMAMGPSGAVKAQESQGQNDLVHSGVLPSDVRKECREALEAHGVVFGDKVEGDELFTYVSLPEGWRKEGTEHAMHSSLLDHKGRRRAGIFYKAAFYDRTAHMNAVNYIRIEDVGGRHWMRKEDVGKPMRVAAVTADGDELFSVDGPEVLAEDPDFTLHDKHDEMMNEVRAWLDQNRPEWRNAAAYWPDDD